MKEVVKAKHTGQILDKEDKSYSVILFKDKSLKSSFCIPHNF